MSIFKAYDIRGIYPSEINENTAYDIGRALVDFYKLKAVCVGRDIRLSSDALFNSLVRGIADQGAEVIDIGLCSTPMFYFAVPFYKIEFGVMVTASHNPKEYNGFKIIDNRTLQNAAAVGYDNGLDKIEEIVSSRLVNDYSGERGSINSKDISKDYISHVSSFANKKLANSSRLKIIIDAGNGTGSLHVKEIFESVGIKYIPLSFNLNGNFPDHGPNPLLKGSLEKLKKSVKKEKAAFGVAFDSDADRAVFVDDLGKELAPEMVLIMLAKAIVKSKKDIVFYDLTSSRIVKEQLSKFCVPVMTKVGQVFIKEKMKQEKAILAGEVSGHYTFRDSFYSDSGLLACIVLMNFVLSEKKKISAFEKKIKQYPGITENITVKNKENAINIIEKHYQDAEKVLYIDGLSVDYKDWRFNIRPSNTEPLIRLRIEAKTKNMLTKEVKKIKSLLKRC
jgi:phosphomannomutase